MVLNSTLGAAGAGIDAVFSSASALAWLLTQKSAAKIEIAPKTAAMPIIVMALPLTTEPLSLWSFVC